MILALLVAAAPVCLCLAQTTVEVIDFNGFLEGDILRDQFMFRGLRLPPDPNGGPFYDDAGGLAFLLDTPPGLLSLNPLARIGGPGQVPSSVGTYVFDFVDPTNPFVPSFTGRVDVVVVLVDKGLTVLSAFGAGGEVLAAQSLDLSGFSFTPHVLSVIAPGIRRATLTTPLEQPTLGALVDTLRFETPAIIPSRPIDIDVRPGSRRNVIRVGLFNTVPVAVLSEPGFEPGAIDPAKILFQRASPVSYRLADRNHDRVADLILDFRASALQGLGEGPGQATLTAVDRDGTPLHGVDEVLVRLGPVPRIPFLTGLTGRRGAPVQGD